MSERAMQELALLVLTALADEPRHGYAIAREIKGITDGRVVPRTGALYGALDRLVTEGLIEVRQEEIVDGRARRVFGLTTGGRERLALETERLAVAVQEARRRLGLGGAPATA
ncbi:MULTISPECIES: PadR family transcriptional regulator [Streptomyces]|uniref:PadR family transcriptional regulator n=1 Tax=Streptomyces tsukubensis (strain DSM 42081 / NBRC 108919 / NRRL 18488 / 9993) TaxID=1114943 RepID=I2MTE3_STRT9|nr:MULTISPECIES: PadR family transcriptional regulator [Streptomyces]AZK92628.1 PadR family transcriptional regulator [Streptomyces tsukubensis]EIF88040.1 PadR-like family transcriptional regulator [Streptomyces tsukubensis NRRL18488]MYS64140.1 PadR family transcriptional regulator [Streptomyces sp. SID5473]QKM71199.1 PadR family transcriptional regulator [Streptomyces tsukubensis NRRL18488]TAI40612.1 PadR family transcriptional regulator [Streptomyces tsukubensis]